MTCKQCDTWFNPYNNKGELLCYPCFRIKANERNRRYYANLSADKKAEKIERDNKAQQIRGWPKAARYRQRHPDRVKACYKLWQATCGTEWRRNWRKAHPETVKATKALRRAIARGAIGGKVMLAQLLGRDGEWCVLCGLPLGEDITVDHLKPVVLGGVHEIYNLGLAHKSCNSSKNGKPFIEWAIAF